MVVAQPDPAADADNAADRQAWDVPGFGIAPLAAPGYTRRGLYFHEWPSRYRGDSMTRWHVIRFMLLLGSGVAMAFAPSAGASDVTRDWPTIATDQSRQGGDTVESATVIVSIPYFAIGTTAGYADDYDVPCPSASASADVVYRYEPSVDQEINIDLCSSSYNTKVYVLDAAGGVVACDDDYYHESPCGPTRSRAEDVALQAGSTYYIVIDGSFDQSGNYHLAVTNYHPHVFSPPWYAQPEGEPPLENGYVDTYNGGCNTPGPPQASFHPYDPAMGYAACVHGQSGWYRNEEGIWHSDFDWYIIQIYAQGSLDLTLESTSPCYVYWLEQGWDCDNPTIADYALAEPGQTAHLTISGPYASQITVVVVPTAPEPPPDLPGQTFSYLLGIDAWEQPYQMPMADYSYGCATISHPRNGFSTNMAALHDDYSPAQACTVSADVARDGIFQVYLWAGQRFTIGWIDIWYPTPLPLVDPQDVVCFYLTTDARMTPGSCVYARCGLNSPYGFTTTFAAEETGWHYLICDYDASPSSWTMFANIEFADWTQFVPPPAPPANDRCEGAPTLPVGVFTIAGDLTDATNSFDPGPDGCVDRPELNNTGRDVVYEVDLQQGQVLDVTMTSTNGAEVVMYLVSDCEVPVGACVASSAVLQGATQLVYPSFRDQTLWLVCDSWGLGERAFTLTGTLSTATGIADPGAGATGIHGIQPNPCNPRAVVSFGLARAGMVQLGVYDVRGRRVASLLAGWQEAGDHAAVWDGRDDAGRAVASGIYMVQLRTDEARDIHKVVVLR